MDEAALFYGEGMALVVCGLEAELGAEVVRVGEVEAAEVVQVCYSLGSRVEPEGRGLDGEVGEELGCEAGFLALFVHRNISVSTSSFVTRRERLARKIDEGGKG